MTASSSKTLTPDDFTRASKALGVPVAAIKAVTDVESRGSGFLADGVRPVILFERHIMRRQLVAHGVVIPASVSLNIVDVTPGGYKGGAAEWDRLDAAVKIDRASALESCSWGLFQIMGFHWKALGYSSAQDFVNAMYRDEGAQLDAFVLFIKANPNLATAMRKQDWVALARGYNGPAFAKNQYDAKLTAAFNRHNKELA